MKRIRVAVVVGVAVTLAAAGCQSPAANTPSTGASAAASYKVIKVADCPADATASLAAGADIKIGLSYPLSGALAANGAVAAGIKAAVQKQNAAGGVDGHKVNVTILDDAYDATRAVSNVTRLIQSDKVMLINQAGTPLSVTSQPLAEKSCTPQLYLPVSADTFVDPVAHPWTTAAVMTANNESGLWLDYLKQKFPNGGKIGAIGYDNDFGKGFIGDLTKKVAGTNFTVLAPQYHATTAVNVDTETATIVAGKPDVVVGVEGAPFCAKVLSGLAKAGYTGPKILASNCIDIDTNYKPVGAAADGVMLFTPFKALSGAGVADDAAIKQFKADMTQFGDGAAANSLTSVGYTMGSFIVATLIAASKRPGGVTRANIAESAWFLDTTSPLAYDGVTFKANGLDDPRLIKSGRQLTYSAAKGAYDVGPVVTAAK